MCAMKLNTGILILVVAVLLVKDAVSKQCGIPMQMQGIMTTITDIIGDRVKPMVERSNFAYDAIGQRVYSDIVLDSGEAYKIIKLYSEGQLFKIFSDGTCKQSRLTGKFPSLQIPPGSYETPAAGQALAINVYSGKDPKGRQYVITATADKCLPTAWTTHLPLSPTKYLVHQRYFSDVKDWVDSKQFALPPSCGETRYVLPW